MTKRSLLTFGLFLLLGVAAVAAEQPAPPPAQAASNDPVETFRRQSEQWDNVLLEMRVLQTKYKQADASERAKLEARWNELVAKGEVLQGQLIASGEKAYLAAPNTDKHLTDFLVSAVAAAMRYDDYETAARLSTLLLDNKCEDKRLYNFAGIAAFNLSDFDAAEKDFALAKANHALDMAGEQDVGLLPMYKQAWAKEQKIRAAEAKADDLPRVLLKTNKGDIELELFENEAPNTVANFISLVDKGFYNGLTFHRVLPNFMAQGGDPTGDGTGGPGYKIACECYRPDYRVHFRGSLSMAHAGRNTGGSQFFITFVPTSQLDGKHTVFGRVIKGFEVLSKLQRRNPDPNEDPNPPTPDKIISASVVRKRPHEYVPKKVGE